MSTLGRPAVSLRLKPVGCHCFAGPSSSLEWSRATSPSANELVEPRAADTGNEKLNWKVETFLSDEGPAVKQGHGEDLAQTWQVPSRSSFPV